MNRSASRPHTGRSATDAIANAVPLSAATDAASPMSWKYVTRLA